jgi:hypothetical protein
MAAQLAGSGRTLRDIGLGSLILQANIAAGIYLSDTTSPITQDADAAIVRVVGLKAYKKHRKPMQSPVLITQTTKPRKLPKFTHFPVEIREIIYGYSMKRGGHFVAPILLAPYSGLDNHPILERCMPAVCFTSKTESAIARSVFIRKSLFFLLRDSDATFMSTWLQHVNGLDGLRSIRRMEIGYMPATRTSGFIKDFNLLRRCPGLRDLTISIPLEELNLNTYNSSGMPTSKHLLTSTKLLSKFQLAGLLKCSNLQTVTFSIWTKYKFALASWLPLYFELAKLMCWMKSVFENRHHRKLPMGLVLSDEKGKVLGRLGG